MSLNAHERYFEMTTEVKTYFSLHDHEETFATVDEDNDEQRPLLPDEARKTIEQLQKTMSWIEAQLQESRDRGRRSFMLAIEDNTVADLGKSILEKARSPGFWKLMAMLKS